MAQSQHSPLSPLPPITPQVPYSWPDPPFRVDPGFFSYSALPAIMERYPHADGFLWTNDDLLLNYWMLAGANKVGCQNSSHPETLKPSKPKTWNVELGQPFYPLPSVEQGVVLGRHPPRLLLREVAGL